MNHQANEPVISDFYLPHVNRVYLVSFAFHEVISAISVYTPTVFLSNFMGNILNILPVSCY